MSEAAVLEAPRTEARKGAAKIEMPLSLLQAALAKINPAVPGASCAIPILQTIRFDERGSDLTFTATNLDLSMRVTMPGVAGPRKPFLVSTDRLLHYVKLLRGDTVSISPTERRAVVKCGKYPVQSVAQLPLGNIENYPNLTFSAVDAGIEIPQSVMMRMLNFVTIAVSKEESRYVLNGALLEISDGKLRLVATDGHRLSRYTVSTDHHIPNVSMLVAGMLMKAPGKILEETQDRNVVIDQEEANTCVLVRQQVPVELMCRRLTGSFPNYAAVMPKAFAAVVTVDAATMASALDRCLAMVDRETQCVVLTVSPTLIQMRAVDKGAGETEEDTEVESTSTFTPFKIGFRGGYLVDALDRLEGKVTIGFSKLSSDGPIQISASPATGETFEYVVMPLRV